MTEAKQNSIGHGKRVLVAMSGGVDSSVAAALLKVQGYEVIGVHMQLWDSSEQSIKKSGGTCCSVIDANDARKVCDELEIPYYVINAREQFQAEVIDYFIQDYLVARTPNPCVMCNNKLKYSFLIKKADELKCHYVATGHYAKVIHDHNTGEATLAKAADRQKDQSYFLFGLKQEQLKRALMPLGDLMKTNVRKLALTFNLPVAEKKDSQEICFIDEGGYQAFVEKRTTEGFRQPGSIVNQDGHLIGRHTGMYKYTIGQRKGLGLVMDENKQQDLYVIGFDVATNTVIVGPEKELYKKSLIVDQCNWVGNQDFRKGLKLNAKIRSRHEEASCLVTIMNNDSVIVEFDEPQRAITPGQAIVFYLGDALVGGGWIKGLVDPVNTKSKVKSTTVSTGTSATT